MVCTIGVAFGVPEPWASHLNQWRAKAGDPQAERIPPHVTLLGPTELDAARLAEAETHLAQVAARHRVFPLHLRGTGTFRPVTDVVFIAVAAGISECELLAEAVRAGPLWKDLRFPYHPHVTVAHDVSAERLDAVFDGLGDFEARFEVDSFTLFEHGTDGRWRPQRTFPLNGVPVQRQPLAERPAR